MDYAGVALLIGLFVTNALALDFLYNKRVRAAGTMNIVAMCLTVGTAYKFNLIKSIVIVILTLAALIVIVFVARVSMRLKKRSQTPKDVEAHDIIDADITEKEEEPTHADSEL